LAKEYGKLGKALGEGAGGNVKVVTRPRDKQIFAVKEFRQRFAHESAKDYSKKISGEYCIGLTLKHPNIVETIDIVYEKEKIYQIMEYCDYDLFAIVMSGKMSQDEIYCDFKQIMSGIRYMHDLGIAHRDLKLDNCCVTAAGIVKIVDFGSVSVFKYPESEIIHEAQGVVGSDPYLAPEVVHNLRYDPRATDVWSMAIIFCCMFMKKFPWKSPRPNDHSFQLFSDTRPEQLLDQANASATTEKKSRTPGPEKLFCNLPEEVRPLMRSMLLLDPVRRMDIFECFHDPWFESVEFCSIENGQVKRAAGHSHTSVNADEAHIAGLEKK
ncbi:Pkinase-domain-containing protein, partial [Nadsonia fulvescens var. elongata DSM 6958]